MKRLTTIFLSLCLLVSVGTFTGKAIAAERTKIQ